LNGKFQDKIYSAFYNCVICEPSPKSEAFAVQIIKKMIALGKFNLSSNYRRLIRLKEKQK
jgi:hypothetical protein